VYGVGDISLLTRHVDEKSSAAETGIAGRVGAVSNAAKSALGRIGAKPRVATSVAVVAILALAVSARMLRHEPASATAAAADAPAREAQAQTAPVEPSPPSPIQMKKSAHVAQSDQTAAASTPKSASAQSAKKRVQVAAVQETRRAAPEEKKPVEKAPEPAQPSGEPATVTLAISPWGQIFVNGQMRGVSPPLQQLELPPGKHRIEVKNSGAQTHVVSLNAKAGERLRIKYKFE